MNSTLKSHKKMEPGGLTEPASSRKNKTGSWRAQRPSWDSKKCVNCMFCVVYCPEPAIPTKNNKRLETNFDYCKGCGICANVCPVKCIKMVKEGEKK